MENPFDILAAKLDVLAQQVARIDRLLASPAAPEEQDRYIGTKEAAALIGRRQDWVRDNIRSIPHSRIAGGQLQFSTLELRAWMEQRFEAGRVPTVAEAAAKAMRGKSRVDAGRMNTPVVRSRRQPANRQPSN